MPVTSFQADYKAWLAADPSRYSVLLRAQVALAWLDRGRALRGPVENDVTEEDMPESEDRAPRIIGFGQTSATVKSSKRQTLIQVWHRR